MSKIFVLSISAQDTVSHLLIIATVVFFERRNFLNRETRPIRTWQLQSLEDVETPTDLPDEGLINSPGREFYQARNLMLTCSVEITAGGETDGAGVALPPPSCVTTPQLHAGPRASNTSTSFPDVK